MRHVAVVLLLFTLARLDAGEQSDRELTQLMIGAWRSPRHDYIYFADGTWWMGNPQPGVTHGRWRIENHTLLESTTYCGGEIPKPKEERYPIQELTHAKIVFGGVYHMKRIGLEHIDEE